jgi:hypothetical protein
MFKKTQAVGTLAGFEFVKLRFSFEKFWGRFPASTCPAEGYFR